ncbi:MAG: dipeptidase [Gammaproteobacteria bacterium]|nr:dipeptidase [Gammaproteobacteria bacterium]
MQRLAVAFFAATMALSGCERSAEVLTTDAATVHARALTLDTHLDTPLMLSRTGWNFLDRHDPATLSHVDWPRIRAGELDAGFWAVFVDQAELTPDGLAAAAAEADRVFSSIHALIAEHPDKLVLATTPAAVRTAVDAGKHAVLIGVENGYALGGQLDNVQRYYDRGARYIGLLHSSNNDLGDSSTDKEGPLHGGLSEFGREVVREMNRLGIMVDVSHAADSTFWDILEVTTAPPIASHSSARAVHDHPRNLSDDMLQALAERGGVVQVNALSNYVAALDVSPERQAALAEMGRELASMSGGRRANRDRFWAALIDINERYPPPLATLSELVDHIDHLVAVMGIDHVGVGADFDGGGGVDGMYDVSEIGNLTQELLKRGYTEADIQKIWSGNLLRVMAEVQRAAR